MFSKKITDSDAFIEMPSATQALYFHLNQAADDDGFNNQIQVAMMKSHASADDLKILLMKKFIIRFESGVIVIKHWRMHNTLRSDRYTPTSFQDELSQLNIKDNKSYTLTDNGCQVVAKLETQYSIDKYSIDKGSNILCDEHTTIPPIPYSNIIDYLNAKTGSSYKSTSKKTQTLIKTRFNEKFTEQDFYTVIDNKTTTWLNDPKMNKYLRPETLFGTKFESYLNEQPVKYQSNPKGATFDDIE
jgi:uncharacterized phage protein (TIGR02220 family)